MKKIIFIFILLWFQFEIKSQSYCILIGVYSGFNSAPNSHVPQAYCDENGKILYIENTDPLINEKIFSYKEGLGRIRRKGKFGFINHKGEVMIPLIYDAAEDFNNGLAKVKADGKWGYINKKGEVIVKFLYETLNNFSDGLASFSINGKNGYLNKDGKEVIIPVYDLVTDFNHNRAWVFLAGKWGCINKQGAFTTPLQYEEVCDYTEGYSWVKTGLLWGMIDTSNKYIIPLNERNNLAYALKGESSIFASVSNGLIISKANNKVGYCSLPSLKKVIPSKFDTGSEFEDSLAIVSIEDRQGIINVQGNYVIEPLYREITRVGQKDMFAAKNENKENGLLNIVSGKFAPLKCRSIISVEKIE